jgi:hypothetical protein
MLYKICAMLQFTVISVTAAPAATAAMCSLCSLFTAPRAAFWFAALAAPRAKCRTACGTSTVTDKVLLLWRCIARAAGRSPALQRHCESRRQQPVLFRTGPPSRSAMLAARVGLCVFCDDLDEGPDGEGDGGDEEKHLPHGGDEVREGGWAAGPVRRG